MDDPNHYFYSGFLAGDKKYWSIFTDSWRIFIGSHQTMKSFVLRLEKGDEAISKIVGFCAQNDIENAWFSGFGAASSARLAIYDLEKKEYIRKEFSGILEILNFLGNVGQMDGKTIVHSHVTLSNKDFSAFGGHVDELIIAATCEIILHQLDITLARKRDDEIGLNLLDI